MSKNTKHAGGRPRKFAGKSKPVTVTLPDSTLELLERVDRDRAKAIVKVTEEAVVSAWPGKERVKLVDVGSNAAVIVAGSTAGLRRIPWLRLVEIAPARFLLAVPSGTALEKLELAISDLIDAQQCEAGEQDFLLELQRHISSLRRSDKMSKSEIILVSV